MTMIRLADNALTTLRTGLKANAAGRGFFSGANWRALLVVPVVVGVVMGTAFGKVVAEWDFSKGTGGWTGNQKVEKLTFTNEGLIVKSTGTDPWIEGPALDLPGSEITRLRIRMKSNADASGEVFYGSAFSAGKSVRFSVQNDGRWHEYLVVIPAKLGAGTRFRLDPCMEKGEVTIGFIKVEALGKIVRPAVEKPRRPYKGGGKVMSVRSDGLEFEHYKKGWGGFVVKVGSKEMAAGYQSELIGVMADDKPEWLNLRDAKVTFTKGAKGEFQCKAVIEDDGGAKWEIQRRVRPAEKAGAILVETQLEVDKDRDVFHVSWLTIFPGLGTFGEKKSQGLLAGLEYLCDEPSSSDADIAKPKHLRRIPDAYKITFPLITITHKGKYIGVIWEPSDMAAVTFDSPDRIYNSGGHVMALSAPGVGELRFENEITAHSPFRLEANKPIGVRAWIIGGRGETIVPAVKQYVDLKGFPAVPEFESGFGAAVELFAHGWLDSQINHDGLFRHAVWGSSFRAQPAADAAMFIDWLANYAEDAGLRRRLEAAKQQALGRIPGAEPFSSRVSHARLMTAPFIFGRTYEFVQQRRRDALGQLRDFDENGIKTYRVGKADYSRTHFAKHANGYAGQAVVSILEGAALSGDKELIKKALELLDKQTALYAGTVPRGAQTWEVPLHTPDILASAHMVKAYTLGHIISGKADYLEQARYWAWTGVPFVYLHPPTSGEIGVYSTTAVLGATNWRAPVWFGRPVQWCGLAYCSALHLLSEYDAEGPWKKIARGITSTGLAMTWPLTDKERVGLLPDFFELRSQVRAGPAINPGTVQAHLPELYGRGKLYDVKKAPARGWFVHAPAAISDVRESNNAVTFRVGGWAGEPYYVLISGLEAAPKKVLASKVGVLTAEPRPFETVEKEYHSESGSLIIRLKGESQVRIEN